MGRTSELSSKNHISLDLLDYADFQSLMNSFKPQLLCHLAWVTDFGEFWQSEKNSDWCYATEKLVKAFVNSGGSKVLITGSCAEYEISGNPLIEYSTPLAFDTNYSIYKNRARELVRSICHESELDFVWARIFYLYGEGQDRRKFIPSILSTLNRDVPRITLRDNNVYDYLHVSDAAEAIVALLHSNARGDYNICSAQPISNLDIINTLAKAMNRQKFEIILSSDYRKKPKTIVGSNKRLSSIGWSQKIQLQDGLIHCIGKLDI